MENKVLVKVTIYTAPLCPHSKKLKEFLDEIGTSYDEKCVLTKPELFDELKEKSNQLGIPAIVFDDNVYVGFDRRVQRRLKRKLGG
ncbi:MAG: hypothetical protein GF411_19615 [Candidatus Lokiarchaeota archaeon]|nr:hypothetical protein [Candidatus Lokiarchaeota archaeon]